MSFIATVPVEFPCPKHVVYEALCDLSRYTSWTSGMTSVSYSGRMHVGLEYNTTTKVLGRVNQAKVRVAEMAPDEAIVLVSNSGLITYRAAFQLRFISAESCSVICNLRFQFSKLVIHLAQPVIESMAEDRIRGDLETLREHLAKH